MLRISKYFVSLIMVGVVCMAGMSAAQDTIYIGVSIPLSGQFHQYGEDLQEAMELAGAQINADGGIDGRPLEFVVEDSEGDPNKSKRIARQFVKDERLVAELGDFSSTCSMAAQPFYDRAGMVQLSPTSSHTAFTPGSPYSFSVSGTSKDQSSTVARMVIERLNKTKLAVLYLNTDWGIAEQKYFVDEAKRLDAELVAIESYLEGTTDFTKVLKTLQAANPELLYLCSLYEDGALITRTCHEMGWNDVVLMGAGPLHSPDFLEIAGEAAEGLFTSTSFFPENPRPVIQQFVKDYQARYQHIPNLFAAQMYDAVNILADAIRRGGTDRQAIRDELANTEGYNGTIGTITFTPNGDIVKEYVLLQVKNGEFVLYQD